MPTQSGPDPDIAAAKAALIRFASSFDLEDLAVGSDAITKLYESNTEFRTWYHEAPELQAMHAALRHQFECLNTGPRLVSPEEPPTNHAA